ncbi:MAG: hypothetical protein IMZ62_12945 [Chloroflexi bacterium]|nr:hypothetical protein [Chloroflexota bacterium]MBE3118185.1 hypothetical protein [Candidatus Atribacteria bacterium]
MTQDTQNETGPAAEKLAAIRNKEKQVAKAEGYLSECQEATKAARESRDTEVLELREMIRGEPLFNVTGDDVAE